jgi:adenylate cyclase
MKGYIGNLPLLQESAKKAGFLNGSHQMGIFRYAPLILRHDSDVYPLLALEAAKIYLLANQVELIAHEYDESTIIEELKLDNTKIPTDQFGRILIPYRGPAYSFSYASATDVLNETVLPEKIANRIIFIGSSASGMGDLKPTPLDADMPAIEIHASIVAGIIDNYLPYVPIWAKGVSIALMIALGVFAALLFPILETFQISILLFFLDFAIIGLNLLLWVLYGVVLSIVLPFYILQLLYTLHILSEIIHLFQKKNKPTH